MTERPRPKLDPATVHDLLVEGRKLRVELEERVREMRTPSAEDLAKRVR